MDVSRSEDSATSAGRDSTSLAGLPLLARWMGVIFLVFAFAIQPSRAVEAGIVKIAVFAFELKDTSAGGGIIAPDAVDEENLKKSTEEARRMLSASRRYSVVDTSSVAAEAKSAGSIQHCNGCEVPLARKLGADQSMIGVFTRVSRTEYALQVLVRDARTGEVLSNGFTGLRMGANDSWPRAVRWLMDRQVLSARQAR